MQDGTIFQADINVAGTIRAGNCVFSHAANAGEVVFLRQADARRPIVVTGPAGGLRGPNVYHDLVLWSQSRLRAATLEDCRRSNLAFDDPNPVELPQSRSPWKNPRPLTLLENPVEAFALQTMRADVRTAKGDALVGVQTCSWGDLYKGVLPAVQPDLPDMPANIRVVAPSQPADERQHRYRTLKAAIADKSGDLTILIRSSEPLEIEPEEFGRSNMNLTIRPDGAHRPVLTLAATDIPNAAMFTVYNGSLTLKGLHFRVTPSPKDDSKGVSVVIVAGVGQCHIEDCVATLDTNDDTTPSLVALTSDPDSLSKPADKPRMPKVTLKDCVIRGKGNVVTVRGSRPFDLEADNVLAALQKPESLQPERPTAGTFEKAGSFLVVIGQPKEPPLSPSIVVLKNVTTYLSEAFLDLRGGESGDKKSIGLVPTQARAQNCIFVAYGEPSFVSAAGVDRDTLTKTLLKWEGTRNLYGNFARMLDVKAPAGAMPMMPADWSTNDWRLFTGEAVDSFPRVTFAHPPATEQQMLRAAPLDFRFKLSDMKSKRNEADANDIGADLNRLPKIDEE